MIFRLILSALVALVAGAGTVRMWQELRQNSNDQIARIAESESYAARSQLIRNVERVWVALETAQIFWATYGQLPPQQWGADIDVDMAPIEGVESVLWDDPESGVRFSRTPENPVFDFRPDEEQWHGYRNALQRARSVQQSTMSGAMLGEDGRPFFEVYLVDASAAGGGRLVAVVDAGRFLKNLLQDESPGYAVRVFWGDVLLYQRGEPAAGMPAEWTREGVIRSSLNSLWRVVHAPTGELLSTLRPSAIDLILVLGLVISVLMGTLTFENWRAQSRARAAQLAERRVAEMNRNLEQEIANRTRELANRTADLQTISDSVAHDLRNPLNAIAMNVQLIEEQQPSQSGWIPESQAALKRINPAVRQMAEILDRLLGLSVIAHSKFQRRTLNMQGLAREVFDELHASEPPPPVRFTLADLPAAEADEKLVRIMLVNLLGNALKYTREKDERRIEIDCEIEDDLTVYRITDNGIGFDQTQADLLFEAFQRLRGNGVADGIGLGLALVARVVERHQGRIWAEGIPGEKATFFFTLEPGG